MATRYTFTDDSADVRLSGFLTPDPGAGAFTGEVTIRVPDETTPALALYNDTWDTDPTDPVLDFYAQDNGDAFIAPHNSGRTLQFGLGSGVGQVKISTAGLGFFGTAPAAKPAVTGALSTVVDPAAKAVLTSLLSALVTLGLVTNSTT